MSCSFQSQLVSIMEVLAKAAVAEINKRVDGSCAMLRLEITQSQRDIDVLKKRCQTMEIELRKTRGRARRKVFYPMTSERFPPVKIVLNKERSSLLRDAEMAVDVDSPLSSAKPADVEQSAVKESILIKVEEDVWITDPPVGLRISGVVSGAKAGPSSSFGQQHCGDDDDDDDDCTAQPTQAELVVKDEKEEEEEEEPERSAALDVSDQFVMDEAEKHLWSSTPGTDPGDAVFSYTTEQYSQNLSIFPSHGGLSMAEDPGPSIHSIGNPQANMNINAAAAAIAASHVKRHSRTLRDDPRQQVVHIPDVLRRRSARFSAEESNKLVHVVKARQFAIFGTARNPPRAEVVKQAWEEVAAAVFASSGIRRTVSQTKKRFSDLRRKGKHKAAANRRHQLATGGGTATVEVLTPSEDVAASTLCPESIDGFGGMEIGGVSSSDESSSTGADQEVVIGGSPPPPETGGEGNLSADPVTLLSPIETSEVLTGQLRPRQGDDGGLELVVKDEKEEEEEEEPERSAALDVSDQFVMDEAEKHLWSSTPGTDPGDAVFSYTTEQYSQNLSIFPSHGGLSMAEDPGPSIHSIGNPQANMNINAAAAAAAASHVKRHSRTLRDDPRQQVVHNPDVLRSRSKRFSAEESNKLVHEVKARQFAIFGTARNPPRAEVVKQAWEEVAAAVFASSGIRRTVSQIKKRFSDLRRKGKHKVN